MKLHVQVHVHSSQPAIYTLQETKVAGPVGIYNSTSPEPTLLCCLTVLCTSV